MPLNKGNNDVSHLSIASTMKIRVKREIVRRLRYFCPTWRFLVFYVILLLLIFDMFVEPKWIILPIEFNNFSILINFNMDIYND